MLNCNLWGFDILSMLILIDSHHEAFWDIFEILLEANYVYLIWLDKIIASITY